MRELHGRHARDRDDQGADAPRRHARDAHQPRHEAVHDAAARTAYALEYRQRVEAECAAYNGRHTRPQDARVGHSPADSTDKPASRIAGRDISGHEEAARRRKPERSWLPSNETSAVAVSLDALFTVVNASYHIIPGKVDGIAAATLGVVVAGVAWANKRWKDKHHADRPEG
jgi:hypothetical protein